MQCIMYLLFLILLHRASGERLMVLLGGEIHKQTSDTFIIHLYTMFSHTTPVTDELHLK